MSDIVYIESFSGRSKSGSVWERVKDWALQVLDAMNSNGIVRE